MVNSFRELSKRGARFVLTEAAKAGFNARDPEWINLGQGQPELGVLGVDNSFPAEGTGRIARIDLTAADYGYGPVDGLIELRAKIAEHYNRLYRRGMPSKFGPENVSIAAGGRVCMSRVLGALDSTTLGLFSPDYMAFEDVADLFSARISPIVMRLSEEDGFAVPVPKLCQDLKSGKLGSLLMSNPRNPTGNLIEGDELAQLVATANAASTALIMDEYYSYYIWGNRPRPVSSAAYVEDVNKSSTVIIDGFTKNFRYPGFRLGWIVASAENIKRFSDVGSILDGGPPLPTQHAVLPLLEPLRADAETAALQPVFLEKRRFMINSLRSLGIEVAAEPAGTFYIFGSLKNLPQPLSNNLSFFREALKRKIATIPGEFFDLNPGGRYVTQNSDLSHYMRFSFGPDLSKLRQGVERLSVLINGSLENQTIGM